MSAIAAFFDLDRTVIDVNSGMLWARHELRERNITPWQFSKAALWTVLYHLSLVDMDNVFAQAVGHYRGVSSEELSARTRAWFSRDVEPRVRRTALEAMADHRSRGHPLVLLTNSSCFEAAVAAETWGYDAWLANVFPVDDEGRLVGTYDRPMCYGTGKVIRAEQWSEANGVDLDRCFFYTDSYSDVPMLLRVGEPRVVSPDLRLRRVARRRGWPILAW